MDKKDLDQIRKVVREEIEETVAPVGEDIGSLQGSVNGLDNRIAFLGNKVSSLKQDFSSLKQETRHRFDRVDNKLNQIKKMAQEDTDLLFDEVEEIKGRTTKLEESTA